MSRAVGVMLIGMLACGLTLTGQSGRGAPTKLESRPSSPIVINEVRFDPSPGDAAFIELLNTGAAPASVVRMAIRIKDGLVMLARVTAPVPPGARVMVWFDGLGRTEGLVLHTGRSLQLDASGGFADLRDERDRQIDAVAWGDAEGSVDRHVDGLLTDNSQAGRTIGRPPGANRRLRPLDWVVFSTADATPGSANPMSPVEDLIPSPGTILRGPDVTLQWYPARGAHRYRVQVGRDETVGSPILDTTATSTALPPQPFDAGAYFWRVQALGADGTASRFSSVSSFRIVAAAALGVVPSQLALRMRTVPAISTGDGQALQLDEPQRVLPVPHIAQHKDTAMIQLENPEENDPHGWDRDHKTYDRTDPSDSHNCVVASTAMINHFHGGNLSQDRIAYEVRSARGAGYAARINGAPNRGGFGGTSFTAAKVEAELKEAKTGPEGDLIFGDGLNAPQISAALTFALDGVPVVRSLGSTKLPPAQNAEAVWNVVKREIDNGRPVLRKSKIHATVVIGYGMLQGRQVFVINDPAGGRIYSDVQQDPAFLYAWFLVTSTRGVAQEAEVIRDSDGDGVVDFDETERFHTDPAGIDTDKDGVLDKPDIASGVFDGAYGYAVSLNPIGRDFDRDYVATELDPDSDSGGCYDGVEDVNGNGHRDGAEVWNFEPEDDACKSVNGHLTYSGELTGDIIAGFRTFRYEYFSVSVALKPETPGQLGGLIDNGSSFRMSTSYQHEIGAGTECPIISRSSASGSGRFRPDSDDVGGTVDETEMVVGATGTVPESYWTDMCVMAGGGEQTDSASLKECTGKRVSKTSRSYTFSCTTPPEVPPGFEWASYSMTGSVTLAPLAPGGEAYPGLMTLLLRNPYHQHQEIALPPSLSVERIMSGVFAPVR